jgi:hypothetical protein
MARDRLAPAAGAAVNSGSPDVVLFCTASALPDSSVGEADWVREELTVWSASISEALAVVLVEAEGVVEADEVEADEVETEEEDPVMSKDTTD